MLNFIYLDQEIKRAFELRSRPDTKNFGLYENALLDGLKGLPVTDDESFLYAFILLYYVAHNLKISDALIFGRLCTTYRDCLDTLKRTPELINKLKGYQFIELKLEDESAISLCIPEEIDGLSLDELAIQASHSEFTSTTSSSSTEEPQLIFKLDSSDESVGAFYETDLDHMFNEKLQEETSIIRHLDLTTFNKNVNLTPADLALIINNQLLGLRQIDIRHNDSSKLDIMKETSKLIVFILNNLKKCIEHRDYIFNTKHDFQQTTINEFLASLPKLDCLTGIKFIIDMQIFGVSQLRDSSEESSTATLTYLSYGGNSFVFKVNDSIAIKVPLDTKISQSDFKSERAILQSLEHDNIIKIINTPFDLQFSVLGLEYMNKGDLFDYISESPKPNQLYKFFCQIVSGLICLESMLVVHRDLKLENILLNSSLIAKIADFGFAVQFENLEQRLPIKNIGTYNYASPLIFWEKAKLKREPKDYITTRNQIDMYSLGMILFIMATGEVPYDAPEHQFDRTRKIDNLPPEGFDNLPLILQSFIRGCCLFQGSRQTETIALKDLQDRCAQHYDMFEKAADCQNVSVLLHKRLS